MTVGLHLCFRIVMLTWLRHAVVSWLRLDKPIAENTPKMRLFISARILPVSALAGPFSPRCVSYMVFGTAAASYYSQNYFSNQENINLPKDLHLMKWSRTSFRYLFWRGEAEPGCTENKTMSKIWLEWDKEAYFVRVILSLLVAVALHWCFRIVMLTWMRIDKWVLINLSPKIHPM